VKCKLRKSLYDYRGVILDMDGTLYYQFPLRLCMAAELLVHYLLRLPKIGELFMLRRMRKAREAGILVETNPVFAYWTQEKPLRYIYRFRDKRLLRLIGALRERGAKIAVYSDYPAERKIKGLRGFTADHCFCADDALIRCLKPETGGLKNILGIMGEPVENVVFIGDRYEKDGKCAEGVGMDYLILDSNPLVRHKNIRGLNHG
jgi:FMN phosphatase YigB (HAD superfamily)